jgi:hypothetical protein
MTTVTNNIQFGWYSEMASMMGKLWWSTMLHPVQKQLSVFNLSSLFACMSYCCFTTYQFSQFSPYQAIDHRPHRHVGGFTRICPDKVSRSPVAVADVAETPRGNECTPLEGVAAQAASDARNGPRDPPVCRIQIPGVKWDTVRHWDFLGDTGVV